jgi:hypothetical protein
LGQLRGGASIAVRDVDDEELARDRADEPAMRPGLARVTGGPGLAEDGEAFYGGWRCHTEVYGVLQTAYYDVVRMTSSQHLDVGLSELSWRDGDRLQTQDGELTLLHAGLSEITVWQMGLTQGGFESWC